MFLLLLACAAPSSPTLLLSPLRAHGEGVAGVNVALRTPEGGAAGPVEVQVETRPAGGSWAAARVTERGAADRLELALVADNSGSEDGFLEPMQAAVEAFGEASIGAGEGGRAGLVRVSTMSSVELPLTEDLEAWREATADLYIRNGWTALWDGVRLGNELLAEGAAVSAAGGLDVCLAQPRRAIVVFTDGQENNSADEHETSYEGDGIDTTLADLLALQVLGLPTPVHTLGIGHEIDEAALSTLAAGTGGTWRGVEDYAHLAAGLIETVDDLHEEAPVCFQANSCLDTEARITATTAEGSFEAIVSLPGLLCGCTRTRGYWMTHPEVWPLATLRLGGRDYSAAEAGALLSTPSGGDRSLQLAQQLIASLLNRAAGADGSEIAATIEAAQAWLDARDDDRPLPLGTRSWGGGEALKDALDAWNNGLTGPGHCD